MEKPFWMWAFFIVIVLVLLVLDLGVFHKKNKTIGVKESLYMSAFYLLIATLYGFWIWHQLGLNSFAEFYTGYLIEKSLSLDNVFLISLVFSSLSIPSKYQHRVLFWGIIGVIIFRAIMIALGATLISKFSWIMHVFAVFMILTGIKMLFVKEHKGDLSDNKFLKWMKKHLPITDKLYDEKFIVKLIDPISKKSAYFLTPLFVALLLIEFIDLIFAVDSVPAIFSITQDPFIIYTSNIFAILGLRSLYFALASIVKKFYYLKYSLALVLIFIGSKVYIAEFFGLAKFPPFVSLAVTFSLLASGCFYSIYKLNYDANKE